MKNIQSSKGAIRFSFKDPIYLLEKNKKKESLIMLFFSFGDFRLKYSTGYKSCHDDWDYQKQRIKQGKAGILNANEVNEHLAKLEINLKKELSRLIADGVPITKAVLKLFLDNLTNKNFQDNSNSRIITFFEYAEEFLTVKESSLSKITYRAYKQTIARLKEYEKQSNEKLDFDSFDKVFYLNFSRFMDSQNYALNTTGKHIKNLKVFLNNALSDGLINNTKFKTRDFKAKSEETTAIFLSESEIKKMHDLDLSKYKDLELARDIFLIGCYTGQRVSDYNGLSAESIFEKNGVRYFKIKQQKTKTIVNCPITKEMREIMNNRHNGLPPKKMHEQSINNHIKQVGQMMELNELVVCKQTKGGIENSELVPKYKLLHSHSARRSFCTNMYIKKMPIIDVMLFSGHKLEREFYKYIRIKDEERASHIVEQGFFNI